MDNSSLHSNPFALMLHPEAVLAAMADSDRLHRLHRRICRPLDKGQAGNSADEPAIVGVDYAEDTAQD